MLVYQFFFIITSSVLISISLAGVVERDHPTLTPTTRRSPPEFGFGFPETTDEEKSKQNAKNRQPLYIPSKCRENELLFPGDQKDDWICDCSPGHVFHPETDRCYEIYLRGPCPQGEHLILPAGSVLPLCVFNHCDENYVRFNDTEELCWRLESPGPCPFAELGVVVGVNVNTFEVECVTPLRFKLPVRPSPTPAVTSAGVDLSNRFGEDTPITPIRGVDPAQAQPLPFPEVPLCANGTKRKISQIC